MLNEYLSSIHIEVVISIFRNAIVYIIFTGLVFFLTIDMVWAEQDMNPLARQPVVRRFFYDFMVSNIVNSSFRYSFNPLVYIL